MSLLYRATSNGITCIWFVVWCRIAERTEESGSIRKTRCVTRIRLAQSAAGFRCTHLIVIAGTLAVDVFANGVILHEILTQQKPWSDAERTKWAIEESVRNGQCQEGE